MNLFKYILILTAVLLFGCQKEKTPELQAGEVKVEAALSPSEIMVGDAAELAVTVYAPMGSRVDDLALPEELALKNRAVHSADISETHERIDLQFQLTSFELGDYAFTNGLVLALADGSLLTNALEEVTLKVVSSLEDEEDQTLAALKPPVKEKQKYGRVFAVMGMVALIALLIGMLVMWLLTRRKQIAAAPKPIIPAHEIARQALRALKEKGWIESESAYEFYFELSLIWRYYLENRFALNAPESTTEEIAQLLASSRQLTADHKSMLKAFLEQADRIKFARENENAAGMQQAFNLCADFVESTQAQPEGVS
jgi:hypothetical protein